MKTREQIITDMCYTWRHDYGIDKTIGTGFADIISSGMTTTEREALWQQMAQIYDNCIAPVMKSKQHSDDGWIKYQWNNWDQT
jgi:hypothetical protein